MKNKIITLICIVALGLFSCVDVLDIYNTREIADAAVWNDEAAAEMYLTATYKTFNDVSQVANSRYVFYDSYTDLMKSTSWDQYNHPYNKSLVQASSFSRGGAGAFECWSDAYVRIRRDNVKLVELERYGIPKYGEDWVNVRRAEIRLCRAFTYYRLIRVYGGVIIRTEKSGVAGSLDDGAFQADIHKARADKPGEFPKNSWKFVLDELEWAAEYLPEAWPPKWFGRATKKTAYGLISRMALFAQEWEIAAKAAEKVKELGGGLADDYAKVFQVDSDQDNSKEILFGLNFLEKKVTHSYDRFNRPFGDKKAGVDVFAEHVPTAELADLYEFKDGKAFSWSTWDQGTGYTEPFTNREPRFHATILYNGAKWESREIKTFVAATGDNHGADSFVDFVQAGSTNAHTCTGYYLRKYLQEGYANFSSDGSYQYDAVLRYAEVLLNKAEAYAEWDYVANRAQALAALNEVRARVGLPAKTATDAPDKDAFMTLLRKERCVELAGEGFRYWDLRRWKLAEKVIHGQMAHGTKITKRADATLSYESVNCDANTPRIFLDKYYYFSLPTSEVSNNNLCEDNPYW